MNRNLDQRDILLITYADMVVEARRPGLEVLAEICGNYFRGIVSMVHVLPFFEASERLRRVLSKTTTQHSAEAELSAIEGKMDPAVLKKPVAEVMETNIATLSVDQSVHDALQLFQKRRFSTYPLVAGDNKLIGVLSREDFFDYMKREDVSVKTTLERIVQYPLPIVKTTASVGDALNEIIRSGRYKCIVTDHDNRLKGIVTLLDLISDAASFQ